LPFSAPSASLRFILSVAVTFPEFLSSRFTLSFLPFSASSAPLRLKKRSRPSLHAGSASHTRFTARRPFHIRGAASARRGLFIGMPQLCPLGPIVDHHVRPVTFAQPSDLRLGRHPFVPRSPLINSIVSKFVKSPTHRVRDCPRLSAFVPLCPPSFLLIFVTNHNNLLSFRCTP